MDIAGRIAVVTGAGIGTGRAIALALAAEGAEVVVSDMDERGGNETVAMCEGRARFLPAAWGSRARPVRTIRLRASRAHARRRVLGPGWATSLRVSSSLCA